MKGLPRSGAQTDGEENKGMCADNDIQCDIDRCGEDNGITSGDVAVISNSKISVDFHGAFDVIRAEIPNRAEMVCSWCWTSSRRGHCGSGK